MCGWWQVVQNRQTHSLLPLGTQVLRGCTFVSVISWYSQICYLNTYSNVYLARWVSFKGKEIYCEALFLVIFIYMVYWWVLIFKPGYWYLNTGLRACHAGTCHWSHPSNACDWLFWRWDLTFFPGWSGQWSSYFMISSVARITSTYHHVLLLFMLR